MPLEKVKVRPHNWTDFPAVAPSSLYFCFLILSKPSFLASQVAKSMLFLPLEQEGYILLDSHWCEFSTLGWKG